ncbi:hypothetical protein C437_15401 [Haloarcula vallismortis ATCC 29715]|uniref:Uncharacterized protein n=1 Tax=Haloarcula vallismortis ATCC 29715 TaxID=662477 RepID=M0J0D8_HALVA|nr:hypothetical protein [Haloarcula vallismortis]EMA01818.1 hypothetical protein C437_15401 [Haloarcula vallismortis ATCC 29715]
MPEMATALLAAVAVVGVVVALGTDRTASAAGTAASGTKRVATSSWTAGLAGAGIGLEMGNQLVMAISAEPFAFTTMLAGVAGALGIEGLLGNISGIQFLLIGISIFLAVYKLDSWRGS